MHTKPITCEKQDTLKDWRQNNWRELMPSARALPAASLASNGLLINLSFHYTILISTQNKCINEVGQNMGNIQGGGRKFMGLFERHFTTRIIETGSHQANRPKICNEKMLSHSVTLCF